MPSSRRLKATGLAALLTLCILLYVTTAASSTRESPFYTRTMVAIQNRETAETQAAAATAERQRLDRLERIEKEHNAALAAAEAEEELKTATRASGSDVDQEPIMPYGASKVVDANTGEKEVAGRKYMKDGRVVTYKPPKGVEDDGVAKLGNVDPHQSHAPDANDSDVAIEAELNDIFRKGPIIIFSKSYCPHSKRAKNILLDQYSIVPPPYVVELDQHRLGPGLQLALARLTGRSTVPNVMINGRSIGGGDDVQELHDTDKLTSTISSMGGKRMAKVQRLDEVKKVENRFKA